MNKMCLSILSFSLLLITSLLYSEPMVMDLNDGVTQSDRFTISVSQPPVSVTHADPSSKSEDPAQLLQTRQQMQQNDLVASNLDPSIKLLNRIDLLVSEIKSLRGQLETQQHRLVVLEKKVMQQSDASTLMRSTTQTGLSFPKYFKQHQTSTTTGPEDEKNYLIAYDYVRRKEFSEAITAFERFVKNTSNSPYLANAHYWLGELYLSKGNHQEALVAFDNVIQNFPKSHKVADATLKKGFIFYDRGQWEKAREQLQTVTRTYPDTTLSRLAASKLEEISHREH